MGVASSPDPPSHQEKQSGEPSQIAWTSAHWKDIYRSCKVSQDNVGKILQLLSYKNVVMIFARFLHDLTSTV